MRITLQAGPWWTFLIVAEDGRSVLVQFDADYCGVARTFGWGGREERGLGAIWEAYEFLERQIGETVDDPGYF